MNIFQLMGLAVGGIIFFLLVLRPLLLWLFEQAASGGVWSGVWFVVFLLAFFAIFGAGAGSHCCMVIP